MSDFMEDKMIPWDFMPPEQHFGSPKSMKDAIFMYQSSRLQQWEKENPLFMPVPGKFEAILGKNGNFSLWPTAMDYVFLFRGQQEFHTNCYPTLYRGEKSADELFLQRLKLAEFELFISQFPSVEFFRKNRYEVDTVGLAQHYLIDTEILDLTSSIDVAMFFAMCDFDGKCYHPKTEEKEYIAYLYAYPFAQEVDPMKHGISGKVRPIGLQPFKRPGEQCGYAIRMKKEESFKGTIYSFSFTKQDSEHIFNWFQQNRPLFFEDEFSQKVDLLRTSEVFSIAALRLAAKRYSAECYGKQKSAEFCRKRMNGSGYRFTSEILPWMPAPSELETLRKEFISTGRKALMENIVVRKTFSEDTGHLPYMTEEMFAHHLFLRMMAGGCPSLPGYDSGFEISFGNPQYTMLTYRRQRPQTVPNRDTRKVDKWNRLDWSVYSKLTIDEATGDVVVKPE